MGKHPRGSSETSGQRRGSHSKSTRKASRRPSSPKQDHQVPVGGRPYGTLAASSDAGFSGQHGRSIGHDGHPQAYIPASVSSGSHRTSDEACSENSMDSHQGSGISFQKSVAASDADEETRARNHQQYQATRADAMMNFVPNFSSTSASREPQRVIERIDALHPSLAKIAAPQYNRAGGIWDEFAQMEAAERASGKMNQ